MNPLELFSMSFRTILSKPLRTLLTMLGVIIGVSSVVTLVSIGQGTSAQIEKQYEGLGTNLLTINLLGNGRATQLDYNNLMQLEQLPEIGAIAPTITENGANVKYDRTSETYNVIGTNDRYMQIQNAKIASGRFIVEADQDFRNHVAVVGTNVAQDLFGGMNPVGNDINVQGVYYTVVGEFAPKGSNINGNSIDDSIVVPLITLQRDFKLGNIRTTYVEATTKDDITEAQNTMDAYLYSKFKSDTGYRINNQDELVSARVAASSTLTNQLIAVACISLLVGGIGIMNIMTVTVSERTREIGIRKSIGAKRRNILVQFLVEAAVISGCGGVIGLLIGIGASIVWPMINPKQPTQLSFMIGVYAFLFSLLVGIIFGMYPAYKAARLRPIDALRTD